MEAGRKMFVGGLLLFVTGKPGSSQFITFQAKPADGSPAFG